MWWQFSPTLVQSRDCLNVGYQQYGYCFSYSGTAALILGYICSRAINEKFTVETDNHLMPYAYMWANVYSLMVPKLQQRPCSK